jgi:hypothetical protein
MSDEMDDEAIFAAATKTSNGPSAGEGYEATAAINATVIETPIETTTQRADNQPHKPGTADGDKALKRETRASGGLKNSLYVTYIKSMGYGHFAVTIVTLTLGYGVAAFLDLWLSRWIDEAETWATANTSSNVTPTNGSNENRYLDTSLIGSDGLGAENTSTIAASNLLQTNRTDNATVASVDADARNMFYTGVYIGGSMVWCSPFVTKPYARKCG